MSEPAQLPPLLDSAIVYRLARSKSWIDPDNGCLLPLAFELRDGEHTLSVSHNCSVHEAHTQAEIKCHAVAEMTVGPIRNIDGLDVIPDTPTHADIVGVPHKSEDPERATYIAHSLSQMALLVWQR